MFSEEYLDLNSSFCDDEFLSQELPLSPKQPNEEKFKIGLDISLTNGNKSTDDEESIVLDSSLQSSTTSRNLSDSSPQYHNVSQNLSIQCHQEEQSFPKRYSESKSIEQKTAEFRTVLDKVNDAYVRWKTNEFVLEISTKSSSWSQQTKTITRTSEIQNKIKLQSENGEVTNLLGLRDEDLQNFRSRRTLALINKSAFRENAIGLVKANLAKLKLQKKSIQDEFGAHSMKVRAGVMTRERVEQLELQKQIEDLMSQAQQLLNGNHTIARQLTLKRTSEQQLLTASFNLLKTKAQFLNCKVSILTEKLDQNLIVDENMREKIDSEGDNLKIQLSEKREKLKELQKSLVEYEKKEATSETYKKLVVEYGTLKKKLDHKKETLKMLNDPNMSV